MKSKLLRTAAFALAAAVMAVGFPISASAAPGDTRYNITSAYENVDWDTWNAYKTQLHCHTIASDGDVQLNDVVELS